MKTKEMKKKLVLNKVSITRLNGLELSGIKGGATVSCVELCSFFSVIKKFCTDTGGDTTL